jgi:hypothetical protein
MSVFFKAPHRPVQPDPMFDDIYKDTEFRKLPNYGREAGKHLAPHSKLGRQYPRFVEWGYDQEESYQNALRKYNQLIYGIDFAIGMVLEELKNLDIDDNTVIIFSSDNGYYNGSHGLGSKVLPYEEGARVPLIIFDPRHKESGQMRKTSSLSGNVDIAATILDLAGVETPPVYDGKSLLPLLDRPEASVRKTLPIVQVWGPEETHCLTVMDEQFKYIYWYYEDAERNLYPTEELFDLQKDPYEMVNLANRPEYKSQLTKMRALYDQQLQHWKNEGVSYNGYAPYKILFDRNLTWTEKQQILRAETDFSFIPFGSGGQLKMIYDRRQRPQALFIDNKVHLVYNGGASGKAEDGGTTYPFVISFDPKTKSLSPPIQLGTKGSRDQHYCPIIWADNEEFLHILYGCHKTPGTHLISTSKASIGKSVNDWNPAAEIRNSMSYPTVYNIYDNKKLVYFRTGEHRSSWSYLISDDEGKTWSGPENEVTDLNRGEEVLELPPEEMDEASSYQTILPSKDGKFLHVAFIYYDDNKKNLPEKFNNPRYQTNSNLGLKFNLYYVKINLQTHEVTNFAGESVKTPIDLESANAKCKIWDTDWRGAGVPPDIMIDENDNPAFLHVLSEDTPEDFNYYYVRYVDEEWKQTVIAPSTDDWNSCYLQQDKNGILHAYLIAGNFKFEKGGGKMDSRGGGNIEEWVSKDKGNTWSKHRDLTPNASEYTGWKFNNIQPLKDSKGNVKEGMLLFYGWKDSEEPRGKAFLLVEDDLPME